MRGFSLVEVLLAMVLGSLLLAGAVAAVAGAVRSQGVQVQLAWQQTEARVALMRIGQDVRMARSVVAGHDCKIAGCTAPLAGVLGGRPVDHARGTDVLVMEQVRPSTGEPLQIMYYVKRTTALGTMPLASLMRCERQRCDEVARGIERLDFVYTVRDDDGRLRYLDARERVDSRDPWRDVIAIEVHLLVNGQGMLPGDAMLAYAYPGEGAMHPLPPESRGPDGISPAGQGFERATLRRPFSALFALRSRRLH